MNLKKNVLFFAEEFLYEDFDFALEKRRTTDTDDYAFLDENENIEDEDVFPKSRQKRSKKAIDDSDQIRSDYHVVYKRKDQNVDHISDYREYSESEVMCQVSGNGYRVSGKGIGYPKVEVWKLHGV